MLRLTRYTSRHKPDISPARVSRLTCVAFYSLPTTPTIGSESAQSLTSTRKALETDDLDDSWQGLAIRSGLGSAGIATWCIYSNQLCRSEATAHLVSMVQMTSITRQFASAARLHALGSGYYGEIGYEIFMVAVRFMFPDNCDTNSYAPLTYDVVLREVLVPEAAARIIQQDLNISPHAAKQVLTDSYLFGVTRHPSSKECPALARAIKYTTQIQQRAKSAYRSWVASKSPLSLNDWIGEQKVKWEPIDVQMTARQSNEVIDLTADSDDED
ncbi:hypothetical protein MSAN_01691300 [Mycena sanguinolenta]|uniref:Restriction of telomere capping protein 4 C-terminal domain-containing protein n=1 Tax=Mycena sanguinolenta TaxID=230812 RepID=A0A8H6XZJ8_9AGAR|nr:hypothetical protein MSAN_01691300 [Mycena sanguinolenta]